MAFDTRIHIFTNNAQSRLASEINSSQTTITVRSAEGALFPSPGVGEIFKVTVYDPLDGSREIMHCTSRSGDVLTVERGQEGTTALAFDADSPVVSAITAGTLEWLQDLFSEA